VLTLDRLAGAATRLDQQLDHLVYGAHVCVLYATAGEFVRSLVPFVLESLRRREQCLYLADATNVSELLGKLAATGMDVQAAIDREDLLFEPARERYLCDGRFDPDAMLEFLWAAAENAREREWAGLRVVGEMTWALGTGTCGEHLAAYEARLNGQACASGMRNMCLYDRRRFRPEIIHNVLRTHPMAIVGDHVHENPFFEPAELVLGDSGDIERRRVDWMLAQIQKRPERAEPAQAIALTAVISPRRQDRLHDRQSAARAIQAQHLTARQRDVLRLLARGWTNREIAAVLGLAPGTVKNHVADILEVLDASDRTQAAVRAVELGITCQTD
jgi:DNA-binding CsgD family transcriptional regulator